MKGRVGSKATWLQLCKDLITLRYLVVHSGWNFDGWKKGWFFRGRDLRFLLIFLGGAWIVDVVEKEKTFV